MPNWCHNTLEVIGYAEEVTAFINKARETPEEATPQPLFFVNFVSEPDYSEADSDPDSVMPDWWNWRVEHWGTKWEPNFGQPFMALSAEGADPLAEKDQLNIDSLGDELAVTYEFDTAWGPPLPVIAAAAEQHPKLCLRITWGEPGNDFGGKAEWAERQNVHLEEGEAADYLPEEKMWF